MGGGTLVLVLVFLLRRGLSPRGRGNLKGTTNTFHQARSIPAWAGEPVDNEANIYNKTVYPRVGGGTNHPRTGGGGQPVYPRVGGGTGYWTVDRSYLPGLSPRGRGNPSSTAYQKCPSRSIPAWAGEPSRGSRERVISPVYPRVGGGTAVSRSNVSQVAGLSPRGRGNPVEAASTASPDGLSPRGRGNHKEGL